MKYSKLRLSIAINLKRLREEKGLNQRELAQKAGVSQKTISNLENINATNETCNLDKLTAVAEALKVNITYLIDEPKTEPEKSEYNEFDEETIEFAKAWKELPREQKNLLAAFVHSTQKPIKKVA